MQRKSTNSAIQKMSKKAQAEIIIKIMLGLIIALVIFIPACKVVNDVLRLSGQGLTSFNELADNIKEVNAGNSGDSVATPVFLDKETAIIGFEKDVESAKLFGIPYLRPGVCPKDKSCLVLCRHMEPVSQGKGGTAIRCRDIKMDEFRIFQFELKGLYDQNSCTNGCEGGFVIARNPLGFSITELPRERVVYADKADSFVALCENRDQEKGCVGLSQVSAPAQPPAEQQPPVQNVPPTPNIPGFAPKNLPQKDTTRPQEVKPSAECNLKNKGNTDCGDSDGQTIYVCEATAGNYEWKRAYSGPYKKDAITNCRIDSNYKKCEVTKDLPNFPSRTFAECKLKGSGCEPNKVISVLEDAPESYVADNQFKTNCFYCYGGEWKAVDNYFCETSQVTQVP